MSPARVCTGAEGLAGQPSEDTCTERFAAAIVKQLVAVIEVSVALVASQEKKFDIPLAACSVCTEGNAGTGCILPDDTCPLLIFRLPSTIFPGQEMDGKLGFERVEGSARRRGACFPLLASRGKTVRAGVHFVIAFLVSIWISLLISRASGMYPRHTPLEPTLQSPEWAGESASEPQMPHRKRAAIRYKNDKASQGLVGTTSPRAINFLGDNPRVSLLEQVPEAQADGGAVRESQASVFRDLASNFYRNWETPRDAEGRRHLALLALTVAAAQEEPRAQPGLLRLLDRAIAEDSAFFLDPVESDGYEQSGSGWRLLRREVLGSGSFNLVLAADVQTPEPEAQQVDSGVIASFQRLLGRFQRGRASIRRKLSGRRGKTGGAAEEPSERREGTTLLSVALRLPFISRRRRQNSDLDAGSLIRDRVRDHYLTKLFSTGVRTNELIETYGFAVPLFFGRARGMPDVLASDNRSLLLNFFEVPSKQFEYCCLEVEPELANGGLRLPRRERAAASLEPWVNLGGDKKRQQGILEPTKRGGSSRRGSPLFTGLHRVIIKTGKLGQIRKDKSALGRSRRTPPGLAGGFPMSSMLFLMRHSLLILSSLLCLPLMTRVGQLRALRYNGVRCLGTGAFM
ncbi:rhoptry kinase family protein [Cystoisospora suis]|uniref:Rhoptry kinase family protein n=1 Tax=Cystoisospora suis TaxID=483139 RepID=A0A2C6KF91_9APIC|nr:rhoptry kinase family protein [Cystoisospora suis]